MSAGVTYPITERLSKLGARVFEGHDPANLDTIQQWQDESLRLFAEVARGGERQAWWEGFLASYYKIAVPMGLRPTVF